MQKALSKTSQKQAAQKKTVKKKATQKRAGKRQPGKKQATQKQAGKRQAGQKKISARQKGEDVIILNNVWKIFGLAADEAMQAIQERGLGKAEVLSEFGCVVGLADCSFAVKRGKVFCIMGQSGAHPPFCGGDAIFG